MENHLAIILYLVSLFFYYVAGMRLSKNNPNASQAFYLLASAQFLYGFTFINELLSLNFFRDSENFDENDRFLILISFAMILAMALITKNFILECGALILYFQAISPFFNGNSFNLILIFINIILISVSGIFTKMTAKISESFCSLVLIIITIFIASNISHVAENAMRDVLAGKISIILMVVNFVGLTLILIFSKNKNYFEKKSLLCLQALMFIFFIPHMITMTICLHIISFSLAILMIFRGRFNAHILFLIILCLMFFIIGIASQGRSGSLSNLEAEGNGFFSFIFLIIVAYCAEFYRQKSLKKPDKNDDQKT